MINGVLITKFEGAVLECRKDARNNSCEDCTCTRMECLRYLDKIIESLEKARIFRTE